MFKSHIWLALFIAFILSACSPVTVVRVNSNPPGASVAEAETNKPLGFAGSNIYYKPPEKSCVNVRGYVVTWQSGAKAVTAPSFQVCEGRTYTFSADRPSSAAGLDKDLAYALYLQQTALLKSQRDTAEAQSAAANAQAAAAKAQKEAAETTQQQPVNRAVTCIALGPNMMSCQ